MDGETSPNRFADALELMDSLKSRDAIGGNNGPSALEYLTMIPTLAAGVGTYVAIQELGFPQHKEYDQVTQVVNTLNGQVLNLENTKSQMTQNGISNTKEVDKKIDAYKTKISVAEDKLPPNYNHGLEEGSSWAGALVVGTVIFVGLSIKAQRIIKRNKKSREEN